MKDYEAFKTDFPTSFHNMVFQFKTILVNCYSADIGTFTYLKSRHNQAMHIKSYHMLNSCMVSLQYA